MKLLQQGEKNRKYQKIRRRNRIKTWNKPKVYGVGYCITRARLAKGLQKKGRKKVDEEVEEEKKKIQQEKNKEEKNKSDNEEEKLKDWNDYITKANLT